MFIAFDGIIVAVPMITAGPSRLAIRKTSQEERFRWSDAAFSGHNTETLRTEMNQGEWKVAPNKLSNRPTVSKEKHLFLGNLFVSKKSLDWNL